MNFKNPHFCLKQDVFLNIMFLLNGCFQFLKNLQKLFNFLESKRQKKYIRIYYDNAKIIKNYLF